MSDSNVLGASDEKKSPSSEGASGGEEVVRVRFAVDPVSGISTPDSKTGLTDTFDDAEEEALQEQIEQEKALASAAAAQAQIAAQTRVQAAQAQQMRLQQQQQRVRAMQAGAAVRGALHKKVRICSNKLSIWSKRRQRNVLVVSS
jgi:hypothetical protein